MFVLLIPVLLGSAAMAVELGAYAGHRRSLQNSADAIALAAAQELPDEANTEAKARAWASKHYGISPSALTVSVRPADTSSPNPRVSVTIDRTHQFHFMSALGINDATVGASATAVKTSPGGLSGVVPWAVLESTRDASEPGDDLVLKYDSNNVETGNFAAIRLDGTGASVYEDDLESGSASIVCADGVTSCAETSPTCDGAVCQTETGNIVGSTRDAVDYRMANTDEQCDTFDEVFAEDDGAYDLNTDCNPWAEGGYASHRVIVLPVISSLCNGSCDVTITGFSLFWLEGYGDSKCTGSDCEIVGTFVNAELTMGALLGRYDPSLGLHYTRLVE